MRTAASLIAENNEKREMLNNENLALYEEFLLYIRTDLRVAEQAGEEVLMDLLDHLLEAQEEGRTGSNLFGDNPQEYADEVIEALPREKKRNAAVFIFSQLLSLAGWFSIAYGAVYILLSFFTEVDTAISLGNILILLTTGAFVAFFAVWLIFKMLRSSLFRPKKSQTMEYVKAGLLGATAFGIIMLLAWLIPEFGPVIRLNWWVYVLIGLALMGAAKVIERVK
ncbi:DUF1129 family protein [Planococcus sp. CAU13]|uniref:DUF1129 family protein n=1 Tax=Planococcus sp. CAU13 TaxID=1541197 RepID=UPI00052FF837|nr:DUF1129 family protein [Planococcus sp. CAU13]